MPVQNGAIGGDAGQAAEVEAQADPDPEDGINTTLDGPEELASSKTDDLDDTILGM